MKKVKMTEEEKLLKLKISDLKKKLTLVFNKYIRWRDTNEGTWGQCISCGKTIVYGTANCQAGHYVDAGLNSRLRYDERNVNGQDVSCNHHKNGNKMEYRKGIIEKYGENVERELWEGRNDGLHNVGKDWYVEKIIYYKNKIDIKN